MYIYKDMVISHHKNAEQTLLKTVFPGTCDVETNYLYLRSSELELNSSSLIYSESQKTLRWRELQRSSAPTQSRATTQAPLTGVLLSISFLLNCLSESTFPPRQGLSEQGGSPSLS